MSAIKLLISLGLLLPVSSADQYHVDADGNPLNDYEL